jgi:hypothetical protein
MLAVVLCSTFPRGGAAQATQTAGDPRPAAPRALNWGPTDRGAMRIDGGASLGSSDETTTFDRTATGFPSTSSSTKTGSLFASVEYLVIGRVGVGLSADYGASRSSQRDGDNAYSAHVSGYSFGPSVTWFLVQGARVVLPYLHVVGLVGRASGSGSGPYTVAGTGHYTYTTRKSARQHLFLASAGALVMFAPHVGADLAIGYSHSSEDGSTTYTYHDPYSGLSSEKQSYKRGIDEIWFGAGFAIFIRP